MSTCRGCQKAVYFAEQIIGPGGYWHRPCLVCSECNKKVDASSLTERQDKVFCKSCYGRLHGPKGYGFGNGGSFLSTDATITNTQKFEKVNPKPESPVATEKKYTYGSASRIVAEKNKEASTVPRQFIGTNVCPTCTKTVYFAEQVVGPKGVKYHRGCFKCSECKKTVSPSSITDRNDLLFCNACYGKKFGPKGIGFGNTMTLTN